HSPRRLSVAASFLTDAALLERHLPEGFALAGEPVGGIPLHDRDRLARRARLHDDRCGLAGDLHRPPGVAGWMGFRFLDLTVSELRDAPPSPTKPRSDGTMTLKYV